MGELASLLPLVVIVLLFWLLIIRPASRRQKDQAKMQSAIAPGDRVMLTAGILGTVVAVEDDRLSVDISGGVTIEVVRGAIGSVIRDEEEPTTETSDRDSADETAASEDN